MAKFLSTEDIPVTFKWKIKIVSKFGNLYTINVIRLNTVAYNTVSETKARQKRKQKECVNSSSTIFIPAVFAYCR